MERPENHRNSEHTIDITSSSQASSSPSSSVSHDSSVNNFRQQQNGDHHSTSVTMPVYQHAPSSTIGSNAMDLSFVRRGNVRARHRSPSSSGLWISVELVLTVSQIVAAIVVLSLSKDEHPQTPLFVWIVGYSSGCVVILPLLYWRYHYRNQSPEQDPQQQQNFSQGDLSAGPSSSSRISEGEDRRTTVMPSRWGQSGQLPNARLKAFVEYFKMGLDCFFAVWFVVGNVWIFGGHSSSSEAPNMYRLCIVFLTFSCIGYAMPFILCATICCCLPCIVSILGFREDLSQNRGATPESINSLPTYKFKIKKSKNKENGGAAIEGGIIAAGTEKERLISGEDAVCCICLARYVNNEELRELPCSHFFHKDCVDKWLKINNACPLCKAEVGETLLVSLTEATANLHASSVL